ncbi:MAG: preprotein translocase subunit SecY [Planctomycetota bacterium]|nr:preprotein translocase subunit SecY [Planctomycetia bacterium]MDO7679078.1 preprotein translocase subunit SecY [Pirellulales bacterium]RLS31830.1 MAG: preprotein translocase subunit SecY [Planctomycetota bacterium]RLS55122.1 MAG: preprotein translocase subunit SecY [Planctomycetota bacterium]
MFEKLRIIFTIPELRQKILLTLGLLAIYRVGWQVPLPIVDPKAMTAFAEEAGGISDLLKTVAVFSASQLSQATIFGLGIMPYISASIIFQLLGTVWAPLERLQKEGEGGRKKINEYTRYATVLICFVQSWAYVAFLASTRIGEMPLIQSSFLVDGRLPLLWQLVAVMTMTAGTIFLMWLGEQIDEFGIGNGISLLIMAGILAAMPSALVELTSDTNWELGGGGGKMGIETLLVLAALFISVVAGVVFMTQGQRRIPTQSAKHVRGRRVYGGTRQYLPLRVNQAGVMPIIFASSLLLFPQMLFQYLHNANPGSSILGSLHDSFTRGQSYLYNVLYVVLIYFFCYFWTAITFNPKDMADNLKNFGAFIPGYRPGKRTADFLERVMERITYVGAAFLALVAIIPTIVAGALGIPAQIASFYGGTGLLIAVSVAFDLVQKIDSHLVMRNYKGLLEKS